MKNDHLPLIQVLKGRNKPKTKEETHQFEVPRTFQVKHHEVPGLAGRKVGDYIAVKLIGHIQSHDPDGHSVVDVSDIKPDSSEMEALQNPQARKPNDGFLRVRAEEGHAP